MYPIALTQGEHSFAKNCEEVSSNFQDIADGVRRTDEKKSEELIEAMAPAAGSARSARMAAPPGRRRTLEPGAEQPPGAR